MVSMSEIKKELENKGFKVECQEFEKNGVVKKGINFKTDDSIYQPLIYVSDSDLSLDIEDVCQKLIGIYEKSKNPSIDIDVVELMKDINFVSGALRVGVEKMSNNPDIMRRETSIDEVEEYVFLELNDSMRITRNIDRILKNCGFSDDAWSIAESNTFKPENVKIQSLMQFACNLQGIEYDSSMDSIMDAYYLTNASGMFGACQMFNKDFIKAFKESKGVESVFVIPSSVHEIILIPNHGYEDIESLSAMVSAVNDTEVKPEDQLGTKAYLI